MSTNLLAYIETDKYAAQELVARVDLDKLRPDILHVSLTDEGINLDLYANPEYERRALPVATSSLTYDELADLLLSRLPSTAG